MKVKGYHLLYHSISTQTPLPLTPLITINRKKETSKGYKELIVKQDRTRDCECFLIIKAWKLDKVERLSR